MREGKYNSPESLNMMAWDVRSTPGSCRGGEIKLRLSSHHRNRRSGTVANLVPVFAMVSRTVLSWVSWALTLKIPYSTGTVGVGISKYCDIVGIVGMTFNNLIERVR